MNACKLCIAAGVDEAAVTFETDEDFYSHVADKHDVKKAEEKKSGLAPEPEAKQKPEPDPEPRGKHRR